MQDILQRMDKVKAATKWVMMLFINNSVFDLCPECRKKFVKHPLGREASKQFDFSKN